MVIFFEKKTFAFMGKNITQVLKDTI